MTAKQIEKEVQRQATLFEERCLKKPLPERQRFFHGNSKKKPVQIPITRYIF